MALDTLISQVCYRARLLERGLHDEGPWSFRFESGDKAMEVPATRIFLDDGVRFEAEFPPLSVTHAGMMHLCLRGEPVSSRDMVLVGSDTYTIGWNVRAFVGDLDRLH